MIIGMGIDIVEISRIYEMLERHGEHFQKKTFTEAEREYCLKKKINFAESFAARFAAKEAAMKALGTGWQNGIGFLSIEIVREGFGAPKLVFHGAAAEKAASLGADRFWVSLSHSEKYAVAQVILEKQD